MLYQLLTFFRLSMNIWFSMLFLTIFFLFSLQCILLAVIVVSFLHVVECSCSIEELPGIYTILLRFLSRIIQIRVLGSFKVSLNNAFVYYAQTTKFLQQKSSVLLKFSAEIYLFKVNDRNTRKRCDICSKLTIKAPERRQ